MRTFGIILLVFGCICLGPLGWAFLGLMMIESASSRDVEPKLEMVTQAASSYPITVKVED